MRTKRILAWILTLTMVMSLLYVAVPVSAETDPVNPKPVVLTKELVPTQAGMPNELRLEAYVTGSLETSSGAVPADIVLVLDQSGSMDDNTAK